MARTPFAALCNVLQEQGCDLSPIWIIDNMQSPLYVNDLMFFYCALKCAKLMKPSGRILGRNIDLIPASGDFRCCEAAQEIVDPGRNLFAEARSNPVAFGICRAACVGLYKTRAFKTGG